MAELPKRYKGCYIGAGYIIPDLSMHELMLAAEDGDETAQACLEQCPMYPSELEYIKNKHGVMILGEPRNNRLSIQPGQWPARFKGPPIAHLQECAKTSFLARRLLGFLARARMQGCEIREF